MNHDPSRLDSNTQQFRNTAQPFYSHHRDQHRHAPVRTPSQEVTPTTGDTERQLHNAELTRLIKNCSNWKEAEELFYRYSDLFNHINVSALTCHLPKLLPASGSSTLPSSQQSDLQQLLEDLQLVAEQELVNCGPRELANIAYGFAKLGSYNRRLMQLIIARTDLSQLKHQELANLTWACATLQHQPHAAWLQDVMRQSAHTMASLRMQEACNIAWAMVKMGVTPPAAWLDRFCGHLEQHMNQCCVQDICDTLWVMATLRQQPPARMLQAVLQRLQHLSAKQHRQQEGQQQHHQHRQGGHQTINLQHLGNILWALSSWQQQLSPQLHKQLVQHLLHELRLQSASSKAASNAIMCLHGLTKLQQPPPAQQMQQLLQLLQAHMAEHAFSSQDCCNLLWCLAKLRLAPPAEWMQQLLAAAEPQLEHARPQELANMMWSLGELRYRPSKAWTAQLLNRVELCICACSSQDIANMFIALAKLQEPPPGSWAKLVLHNFVTGMEDRIVRPQEVANVAWSLPLLGLGGQLAAESCRLVAAEDAEDGAAGALTAPGALSSAAQRAQAAAVEAGADGTTRVLVLQLAEICRQHLAKFSTSELVQVIVGMSRLRAHPGQAWCSSIADAWAACEASASGAERREVRRAWQKLEGMSGCDVMGHDDVCIVVAPTVGGQPGRFVVRGDAQAQKKVLVDASEA